MKQKFFFQRSLNPLIQGILSAENLYMLYLHAMLQVTTFTFNFIQENTYVIFDDESREAVIIDAGNQFPEENDTLFNFVSTNKLKVIRLLNTHTHIDHILGNEACALQFNLLPEMHEADTLTFEKTVQSAMMWGVNLNNSPRPKASLKEHDIVKLGSHALKILFTPGHCAGHVAFYAAENNFIISGDVIFQESIGRTDLPGGNLQTLINSIQEKIYTLPPQTIIYSGHGDPTSVAYEMRHNPFVRA